jgi:Cytochrome P460
VKVNPVGIDAFLARTPVPVGTVVVKEKMTGGTVVAVGTMTKREPGYDADHGDWEYGYRELKGDAPPPTTGKIDSCIACHRIAEKKDFLFRTYLPHQKK